MVLTLAVAVQVTARSKLRKVRLGEADVFDARLENTASELSVMIRQLDVNCAKAASPSREQGKVPASAKHPM